MKELQPPLDYDDSRAKSRLYLKDDEFTVFVNEEALADLRWSLWWLAAEAPQGEDVSIHSFWKGQLAGKGTEIIYCEIALTGEGRSHNPKSDYRLMLIDGDRHRLNLYVTREPAKDAFFAVQKLGFNGKATQKVQIFGLLWIVPLTDSLWPATRADEIEL